MYTISLSDLSSHGKILSEAGLQEVTSILGAGYEYIADSDGKYAKVAVERRLRQEMFDAGKQLTPQGRDEMVRALARAIPREAAGAIGIEYAVLGDQEPVAALYRCNKPGFLDLAAFGWEMRVTPKEMRNSRMVHCVGTLIRRVSEQ